MGWQHYVGMILLLVIGYWVGTKYPGLITKGTGGLVTA